MISTPSRRRHWSTLALSAALLCAGLPAAAQETKPKTPARPAQKKAAPKKQGATKAAPRKQAGPAVPPPTHANVAYGPETRQVLDFWKADTDAPAPLVVFIHGGGWMNGDKGGVGSVKVPTLLKNGISVAAINYRFISHADDAGIKPPVKWPLTDAARAIQFLRSKAGEWNIDKTRVGATGGSAGACTSLWLAFHDDLAKPDGDDPIARESTRLTCAAVLGAQTSLDPVQLRRWMPNMSYGGHAFGFRAPGRSRPQEFQAAYDHRDELTAWIKEYSPIELISPGDAAIFFYYPAQDKPAKIGEEQKDPTHSAVNALEPIEKLKAAGVEARLSYPGHPDPDFDDPTEFLIAKLKGTQGKD